MYCFPWNISSYIFGLCLFILGYLLSTAVFNFSSLSAVSTTTVIYIWVLWIVPSSPKGLGYPSMFLSSYIYNSGISSTFAGTPVTLVVVLVLLAAYTALWASLNSLSVTADPSIMCSVSTPGISAASLRWLLLFHSLTNPDYYYSSSFFKYRVSC